MGLENRVLGVHTESHFIDFPPRDEIVSRLRDIDDSSPELVALYDDIAERLASRTYESSASAFILIEIIYDFEEGHGGNMSYLLPRYVLTLTGDRELALSALSAFNEIKDAIRLQAAPKEPEPEVEPEPETTESDTQPLTRPITGLAVEKAEQPGEPAAPPPRLRQPEQTEVDRIMSKLQNAQKTLSDQGLSTRVSIDLTMRRPTRERVSRTLQEISSLRSALRRFEELLSEAELQVLEAAGVLWDSES